MITIHKMILQLCKEPKTHTEVQSIINANEGINISGVSMAAYLSGLWRKELVKVVGRKGRYRAYRTTRRGINVASEK